MKRKYTKDEAEAILKAACKSFENLRVTIAFDVPGKLEKYQELFDILDYIGINWKP